MVEVSCRTVQSRYLLRTGPVLNEIVRLHDLGGALPKHGERPAQEFPRILWPFLAYSTSIHPPWGTSRFSRRSTRAT